MSLPDREELGRGLSGALLLLRQNPDGMRFFDISARGFWRSFYAAFFAGPAHLLLIALQPAVQDPAVTAADAGSDPFFLGTLLGHLLIYAINWLAWPVVADALCRNLQREGAYPGYIIAYNWARVIQIYAVALVTLLSGMILPDGGAGFLVFLVMLGVLYYDWAIARVALKLPAMAAAGVVMADLILGLFIFLLGESLLS